VEAKRPALQRAPPVVIPSVGTAYPALPAINCRNRLAAVPGPRSTTPVRPASPSPVNRTRSTLIVSERATAHRAAAIRRQSQWKSFKAHRAISRLLQPVIAATIRSASLNPCPDRPMRSWKAWMAERPGRTVITWAPRYPRHSATRALVRIPTTSSTATTMVRSLAPFVCLQVPH